MEAKLDELLMEDRKDQWEGSVISEQTTDSLSTAEKEVWRSIRKELEDIGLSVAAFDANKDFIFSWLMKAIANGAFEEQAEDTREVGPGSGPGSGPGFAGSASTTRPALTKRPASTRKSVSADQFTSKCREHDQMRSQFQAQVEFESRQKQLRQLERDIQLHQEHARDLERHIQLRVNFPHERRRDDV